MSRKKRDSLLIAILMIVFGLLLVITSSLEEKGDIAYIKVRDQVIFTINLETGTYKAQPTQQAIEVDIEPTFDDTTIYVGDQSYTLTLGSGLIVYEDYYYIKGGLGYVVIHYQDKKVEIAEENSPYNICSKQGFSDTKPIICLPNYVTIEFSNIESDVIL